MTDIEEVLLYQVLEAVTDRIEDLSRTVRTILTNIETIENKLASHSHGYVHPPVYGG